MSNLLTLISSERTQNNGSRQQLPAHASTHHFYRYQHIPQRMRQVDAAHDPSGFILLTIIISSQKEDRTGFRLLTLLTTDLYNAQMYEH
jgi:hypothetical protein